MRYFMALLVGCTFFIGGCGGSSDGEIRGTVSGKVTFAGEPVPEGVVLLTAADGNHAAQGEIRSDGSYSVRTPEGGLPVGEYQVAVLPPTIVTPDTADSPGGEVPKEVDNIPEKYRSAQNSGLLIKLERGSNTFDISMEE